MIISNLRWKEVVKMKYVRCFLFVAVSVTLTFSAWTDVSGIVESNGDPVSGAKVEVLSTGFIAVTDDDGQFSIDTAYASVEYRTGLNQRIGNAFSLNGNRLKLHVFKGKKYDINVYGTNGRTVYAQKSNMEDVINLNSIIKSSGIYILRVQSNTSSISIRLVKTGNNSYIADLQGISNSRISSEAGLEKVLAPKDTLFVSAYGYEDKVYPIEEYSDGLSIELTELNGDDFAPPGMKLIQGGTYLRGSGHEDANSDESPVREITISSFYMDTTEVTQADYFGLTGVKPWMDASDDSEYLEYMAPYFFGDRFPSFYLTWYDAILYCNERSKRDGLDTVYSYTSRTGKAFSGCENLENIEIHYDRNGYRLPTESEWEYAARGGTTTMYYWGNSTEPDTVGQYEWYAENSEDQLHNIASKEPNPFGLYDMLGSVEEPCNDWHSSFTYEIGDTIDPRGPEEPDAGHGRIVRGGDYPATLWHIRCALRGDMDPSKQFQSNTIRVVLPIQ